MKTKKQVGKTSQIHICYYRDSVPMNCLINPSWQSKIHQILSYYLVAVVGDLAWRRDLDQHILTWNVLSNDGISLIDESPRSMISEENRH